MALFDIMAQSGKQSLRKLFSVHFKEKILKIIYLFMQAQDQY